MNRLHVRRAFSLLALALAGCNFDVGGQKVATDSRCAAAIDADPTVQELRGNSAGSQSSFALTHLKELADAERDANLRCLRDRGLITGGGVERARSPAPASIF